VIAVSYYTNLSKKDVMLDIASATTQGKTHPWPVFLFLLTIIVSLTIGLWLVLTGDNAHVQSRINWGVGVIIVGVIVSIMWLACLRVADQWDRVVVLRFGRFTAVRQPGVFFLVPFVDTIGSWIDTRVHTTSLLAEQTLTKDTVPVDVDAVMFWFVFDPKKAALEVEQYHAAVSWAAQTALRDLIGQTDLAMLLTGRQAIDQALQELIDSRTTPWGITVNSVEIRDVKIPAGLQDAMSRQAQAERERQARVILGESELQIAASFAKAAESYVNNPTAMHLRAMNMLFEGLKERGALMVVPSSALDTMNLGGYMGMAAASGHQFNLDAGKPPASDTPKT
jgi:hypothetical protein